MIGATFKLNFITGGEGFFVINEPVGIDGVDFVLKQDDKRYGRDVSYGGGESEFTFYALDNHKFELLIYYYETYGFESEVQLIIEIDGIENIIGDLHFPEAITDMLEYFKCKVVQKSSHAIVKRRMETNIDVFSDKNVDLEPITPLIEEKILIKSQAVKQYSSWETIDSGFYREMNAEDNNAVTAYYAFNPCVNLKISEIENSLPFFEDTQEQYILPDNVGDSFLLIEAINNLKNINIKITNLNLLVHPRTQNGGNGYIDLFFKLRWGNSFSTAHEHIFFNELISDTDDDYRNNNDYNYTIPNIVRGEKIWVFFFAKIRQSNNVSVPFTKRRMFADTTITKMNIDIDSVSKSYSSIASCFRLGDVIRQNVKSISGLPIDFEMTKPNGELYNNVLTNGNLLRNIVNRPFYISFKEIIDWLPEINGDYEIGLNNSVFFGVYKDFYKNEEIAVFSDARFSDYTNTFNKRYLINKFILKYSKYQSKKEKEVNNTFDVIHGDSEWNLVNKFVENKKESNIIFVRDAFLIDEQRKKALSTIDTTSTQDDETKFIIDSKLLDEDITFTETDLLFHEYLGNNNLKLSNSGEFSFLLLGLGVGELFTIFGAGENNGFYNITEVKDGYIIINGDNAYSTGQFLTTFIYIVSKNTVKFISKGNEDFTFISNMTDEDGINMKYSIKRNILRFYNEYLATCNIFRNKEITNGLYLNNAKAEFSLDGLQTIESESFTPENPILSPSIHKVTIITDFLTYKKLENDVRSKRGYIRVIDPRGFVLKLYAMDIKYRNNAELGELNIIGEEKYNPVLINITYSNLGYITINNEFITTAIKFSHKGDIFYIFDESGLLLYSPIQWQKITINNVNATSKAQLIEWLTLIS